MRDLPMEQSLAAQVVRSGEAVAVADLASDPRAVDPSVGLRVAPAGPGDRRAAGLGQRGGGGAGAGVDPRARRPASTPSTPALPASFAEQAALAIQVARAREDQQRLTLFEDRDRIGRDLHDLVIQRLFAVGLSLQSSARLAADPELAARLEQAVDDLDGTIKDIRRTIFALGLARRLGRRPDRDRADRGPRRGDHEVPADAADRGAGALPGRRADVAPDLLAVLGEALSNASRHAQASSVEVLVSAGDEIVVRVTDDGKGMDEVVLESGLGNMRQRAHKHGGTFEVRSESGAGTTVTWTVPGRPLTSSRRSLTGRLAGRGPVDAARRRAASPGRPPARARPRPAGRAMSSTRKPIGFATGVEPAPPAQLGRRGAGRLGQPAHLGHPGVEGREARAGSRVEPDGLQPLAEPGRRPLGGGALAHGVLRGCWPGSG